MQLTTEWQVNRATNENDIKKREKNGSHTFALCEIR